MNTVARDAQSGSTGLSKRRITFVRTCVRYEGPARGGPRALAFLFIRSDVCGARRILAIVR